MLVAVLRRDRWVVAAALLAIILLAWAYIGWLAVGMSSTRDLPGMDMSGVNAGQDGMGAMVAPSPRPWSVADFNFSLAMWVAMMVGMMTPSAAPMVLIYARVARQAAGRAQPFGATLWFVAGYLVVWCGFALAAALSQWGLQGAKLVTPAMASASQGFGGIVLIVVGAYQWTPLKGACLSQCQAPLVFIQRQGGFRRDPYGSFRLGARHGTFCVGCCWALMTLLFVGGVMNILWIAAITIFVLLEKLLPLGALVSRIAGAGCIAAGAWLLVAVMR